MDDRSVVVVGGGISGLAAAYALASGPQPPRITVIESSPQLGGKLRGGEVEGIPVDLGAEALLARRPEGVELVTAVGLAHDLVRPATISAGLWIGDRIRPIPPTMMGVPMDPAETVDILGKEGAAQVAQEADLPAPALTEDVSIGEFVAGRMGRAVTDKLIDPLLAGVYAGRADELSFAAAVPELFAKLRIAPSLLAATAELRETGRGRVADTGPAFAGIRGGVHRLIGALEADLVRRGVRICRSEAVHRIRRAAAGYELEIASVSDPRLEQADAVVLAVPAPAAARMLQEVSPAAVADLASIDYASMAIVTLAVRERDWPTTAAGSGFLVPSVEGRTIKASTYSHAKWPWVADAGADLAVLRCSVGRRGEEWVLQRSDEDLVTAAVTDLGQAVGLQAEIVGSLVTRWSDGLPQYTVGHLDRVGRVEAAVAERPGLALCGASYRGVGIHMCIASGQKAATQVQDHLATMATRTR